LTELLNFLHDLHLFNWFSLTFWLKLADSLLLQMKTAKLIVQCFGVLLHFGDLSQQVVAFVFDSRSRAASVARSVREVCPFRKSQFVAARLHHPLNNALQFAVQVNEFGLSVASSLRKVTPVRR
jgi:hypothetical protein